MSEKYGKEFRYLPKEDYDKKVKINGDEVEVYSDKKLEDLYPDDNYEIVGETYEKRKRDKKNDIGKIELNDENLYVGEYGKTSRLFRKEGKYVAVEGGGFIALLKLRLLPIIIIIALLLGGIGYGAYTFLKPTSPNDEEPDDHGIKPAPSVVLTVSGTVTANGAPVENAKLSLRKGNTEVGTATTDKDGKYLINDVKNGSYNLVCINGKASLTNIALIDNLSLVSDFDFGAIDGVDTAVNAIVKMADDKTPPIAVGGLAAEAKLYTVHGQTVDLTLLATQLDEETVPTEDKEEITAISGELEMTFFDFSILKEIFKDDALESSEYLKKTGNVLEIAIPYDSSHSVATYAFRYHDGVATKLEALSERPSDSFKDGTCYVASNMVFIYTDSFSTYAVGAANSENVVRGSDTITYSGQATLDLNTKTISLLYKHDADSTNDAKIQVYLVGDTSNLLIAESEKIPVGYQIESVKLKSDVKNLPSVGTYSGLMKIIYLGTDGSTSTNVDIPLTIAIVK